MRHSKEIVDGYASMWPRVVFDAIEGRKLFVKGIAEDLRHPGVYILYRDDHPYYVGKTSRSLFERLHVHSNQTTDRYFNLWNYFSFFVVHDKDVRNQIEGILIASLPATANSAKPRIPAIKLPKGLADRLRQARQRRSGLVSES